MTLAIHACPKPVIAAINGAAVGIGATMTLAMDIRLASTKARIGFVFGRLGIVPEACSTWFLPRIVGIQQALEWVYSAEILTAEAALAGRLLRSVHEPDELLPRRATRWPGRSSSAARRSRSALAKQLLYRNAPPPHPLEAHRADRLAMWHTSRRRRQGGRGGLPGEARPGVHRPGLGPAGDLLAPLRAVLRARSRWASSRASVRRPRGSPMQIGYTLMTEQSGPRELVGYAVARRAGRLRLRGDQRPLLPLARRAGPRAVRLERARRRRPGDRAGRADDLRDLPDDALPPGGGGAEGRDRAAALRGALHASASARGRTSTSTSSAAAGPPCTCATRCWRRRSRSSARCSTAATSTTRGEHFDVESGQAVGPARRRRVPIGVAVSGRAVDRTARRRSPTT